MAYTKDEKGREKALPKKIPGVKPLQNTNPYSLPGNPNEGEQNRKMKENYEKQHRWDNNNPYYPKAPTKKFTTNKKVKVGDNSVNMPTAKKIAEAFSGSVAKTKTGKLVGSSNVNTARAPKKKSGKSNGKSASTKAISGVKLNTGKANKKSKKR